MLEFAAGEVNSGRHVWAMSVQDLEKVVRVRFNLYCIRSSAD